MQSILIVAGIAVGAALLGTGFLSGSNEFQIWVQDLGFAESEIESPIEHANIDFVITKTKIDPDDVADSGDEFFSNDITACSFHTFEEMDDGSDVICKLFSWDLNDKHVVVCEGRDTLRDYTSSDTVFIDITQNAYIGACDVQNIDKVKIVATGEEPMSAFCDLATHVIIRDNGNNMFEPDLGEACVLK